MTSNNNTHTWTTVEDTALTDDTTIWGGVGGISIWGGVGGISIWGGVGGFTS